MKRDTTKLSLTITTDSADTISKIATISALLDAYKEFEEGGEYSDAAFSADHVFRAVFSVMLAAEDLFRHREDSVWNVYDGLDLSLGHFGEYLIRLGTFLSTHPDFVIAKRYEEELIASHQELDID